MVVVDKIRELQYERNNSKRSSNNEYEEKAFLGLRQRQNERRRRIATVACHVKYAVPGTVILHAGSQHFLRTGTATGSKRMGENTVILSALYVEAY
jgi:hypothetical protein